MVGCQIAHKRHSPWSNFLPAPLLWLYSKEQDYRWTQTSILKGGDQPHSSLRTAIYTCGPRKWHHFLFTAGDQQGIFHVLNFYTKKMITLCRKKVKQFLSLYSFLPRMAQATRFAKQGLPVGITSSQVHQELVCFRFDLSSHRKDAVHLSILGTECCDPLRIQKH